jgi:pimeloyl-ACP methyl ester carboxylesterase
MSEPTRPLRHPVLQDDGSQVTRTVATPKSFNIRGRAFVGSNKVVPVIFIPGTMGTNLRVRRDVPLPRNFPLGAGDPAWRPPSSKASGLLASHQWANRSPAERQMILNPRFLEVDDSGELDVDSCPLERSVMRERGWGAIFTGSYGKLLYELQSHLDMTFRFDVLGRREIRPHWKSVMEAMQGDHWSAWGIHNVAPITEHELEKFAAYQYPIYAFGYNWLESCAVSGQRLQQRTLDIIQWWQDRKHKCEQVILITHSMGGLVARACAKNIPGRIAGVIHGVMPALGAPLAYRRIACGTEASNPANDGIDNFIAARFADIAGVSTDETTPVMAAAPGALELLPNHLYPRPWLHVRVMRPINPANMETETAYDYLHLPADENPYNLYRETRAWYRLLNPALADPAGLYAESKGGVESVIATAIDTAERFHRELGDYYHLTTFTYHGNDKKHLTYGQVRWVARERSATTPVPLTWSNIKQARFVRHAHEGGARTVEVEGRYQLVFEPEPQDAPGDDTVPQLSGAGPEKHVKQCFPTQGYRHQESYKDGNMILLTRHLIVKIVQGIKL